MKIKDLWYAINLWWYRLKIALILEGWAAKYNDLHNQFFVKGWYTSQKFYTLVEEEALRYEAEIEAANLCLLHRVSASTYLLARVSPRPAIHEVVENERKRLFRV